MRAAARSPIARTILLAFLISRVVVWLSGVVAMLIAHQVPAFDPARVTTHLGHTGNVLLAPALRWDAVWYETIARHGYSGGGLASFFPLYPLSIRGLGYVLQSTVAAGIVISFIAFPIGLFFVYRLAEMDFGPRVAADSVWLIALFPMSFFFSAVYTESLFLALSAGSIYFARQERWLWAGLLGALASATRNVGVLLVVPLALFYLQQRRRSDVRTAEAAGVAAVPVGEIGYIVGMAIGRGTPFAMLKGGPAGRGFVLPPVTVFRQLKTTGREIKYRLTHDHFGFSLLDTGLPETAACVLALLAAVGVARRLHHAYTAYVVVGLLVLLSEPKIDGAQPLTSFPRYIMVLFPLWIWLALWAGERRLLKPLLAVSAILMIVSAGRFATWHFVA